MTYSELSFGITAVANAIACEMPDNDELGLVGSAFSQLGDTLSTISTQRSICQSKAEAASKAKAEADSKAKAKAETDTKPL